MIDLNTPCHQSSQQGKTLYDKLWEAHLVSERADGTALIYIDRHLLHEVTSPQAFEGLRLAGHNVPTTDRRNGIEDEVARLQVVTLDENCQALGIPEFKMDDPRQGIVHVVGPEQGATLPGMTIVCGDSHTATHGALGALAHGIGTSEVEHVLATQCLIQQKMKNFRVHFVGEIPSGVYAKDLILALIGRIGTAGGTGYTLEFAGEAIAALSIEGRMTLCNMAIEAGARSGLIGVDDKTIAYFKGRPFAPSEADWPAAEAYWRTLVSDADAVFDRELTIDVSTLAPQVTWGTSPEMVVPIDAGVPTLDQAADASERAQFESAYQYMGLKSGQALGDIPLDRVFIGSCTNSRLEDLREAAKWVAGKRVASSLKQALVVPGSGLVKAQA
ncbi:MAG: 3-isopropylmalate dehydratase large subunit, partial [Gammaproteobacteria bacterium]